jgi:hypothetical protein
VCSFYDMIKIPQSIPNCLVMFIWFFKKLFCSWCAYAIKPVKICETFDRLFIFSVLQLSHLKNEDNTINFIECFWVLVLSISVSVSVFICFSLPLSQTQPHSHIHIQAHIYSA